MYGRPAAGFKGSFPASLEHLWVRQPVSKISAAAAARGTGAVPVPPAYIECIINIIYIIIYIICRRRYINISLPPYI